MKNNSQGFSLIETVVVMGLMLAMIAATIMGVSAYNAGKDRAVCIVNQVNVQTAVRSLQNMYEFNPGDTFDGSAMGMGTSLSNNIFGPGKFMAMPSCPAAGGLYTCAGDIFPIEGVLWMTCSLQTTSGHVPKNATNM